MTELLSAAPAAWWTVSLSLIALGIAGTVLPVLPGTLLVLAGIVLGAWIDGFTAVSGWTVGFIAVLAALAWLTDWVAALLGAKKAGASRLAVLGAGIGTVLGVLAGFVGLLFFPLAGAMAGEYWSRRSAAGGFATTQAHADAGRQAAKVGVATWIGLLLGTVVKLVLSFVMVGVFAVAYFV